MWDKVFKNGPSKICGRQSLKNLNGFSLLKADHDPSNFLKAVFHKFYLVHSWILCLICTCMSMKLNKKRKFYDCFWFFRDELGSFAKRKQILKQKFWKQWLIITSLVQHYGTIIQLFIEIVSYVTLLEPPW